ncbi:MAG: hypothetical protein JWP27_1676 [Flaviaesturariibacter sp.]|nr:hypothetical protein [Flaviaesturariibacter sp.]
MHYLFERRLNMLDVELNALKDDDLQKEDLFDRLVDDYRIAIPELNWDKAKYEVKKERLTLDNAPAEFHVRHGEDYHYVVCTVPFSETDYITDIFKMAAPSEGLSIKPKEIEYREYSHDKIEENDAEYERIKTNARKAAQTVDQQLDEFAADAVEFNQVQLPAAVGEKIAQEKSRRIAVLSRSHTTP